MEAELASADDAAGSPAHVSYWKRICNGPALAPADAAPRQLGALAPLVL